jgi:zinc transport system permease protein
MTELWEALHFGFMQRALLAGSLIAVCCAFLGVFLVLRRFSLIGDGLAHFSFATVGLGLLLQVYPLYVAVPCVVLAALAILYLPSKATLYGDAAIGMFSALGVAGGVMLASLGGGFNVDLFSYLFGDILAVSHNEVIMTTVLSLVVIALILMLYQELFAITFDEQYAAVLGINTARINRYLAVLTALTVVLGIKVVGTMLVSSLLVFPCVSALQVCRSFKTAILLATLIGLGSVIGGIFLAFLLNLPAGATIVLLNFCCFVVAFSVSSLLPNVKL